LAKEKSFLLQENESALTDASLTLEGIPTAKKKFIEPEISAPVDVLEATTFFQTATSGATN
jgi:uncharacterized membrane protein YebE (DUF533 family)